MGREFTRYEPTASAVVGDIMALADPIAKGGTPLPEQEPFGRNLAIRPIDELKTRYYVRLTVEDRLGTLGACTNAFAECGISISHISQTESTDGETCTLIYVTHEALEKDIRKAEAALEALEGIRAVSSIIRVENIDAWTEGVFDN